ncbi:MAG: hypothetical protein H0W27_01875 [Actinobacteria bacterium]|nr:hypothetical protein [Actinomycetota bacterium]
MPAQRVRPCGTPGLSGALARACFERRPNGWRRRLGRRLLGDGGVVALALRRFLPLRLARALIPRTEPARGRRRWFRGLIGPRGRLRLVRIVSGLRWRIGNR